MEIVEETQVAARCAAMNMAASMLRWITIAKQIHHKSPVYISFISETVAAISLSDIQELCSKNIRSWAISRFELGKVVVGRGYTDIIYWDEDQRFVIRCPQKRGPKKYFHIRDANGDVVMAEVEKYIGPSHNFHGIPTTPKMLGYKSHEFSMRRIGQHKRFEEEDVIVI